MGIQVKVYRVGQKVATIDLAEGSTVEVALTEAGVSAEGTALRVNGGEASPATPLSDGDQVTAVPRIRGGV